MKKLAILLTLLIGFSFSAFSQGTIVQDGTIAADSLQGKGDVVTLYTPLMDQYWDYSVQIQSTFAGLGDSSNWVVKTYQTNDPAQSVWTLLPALNDTLATVTDESAILIEKSDFQGMWMKHEVTNVGLDTCLIEGFWVRKQKRSRFF